jgi:alkylhydroperoxidase family enzyme
MANHLSPLPEPWPAEVAALLAAYPASDGYLLALFRTFAQSPRFLKKGVPNLLDRDSPLPLRVREITILRITAFRQCEYEWGVHVAIFAKAARLTPEQVAATLVPAVDSALWTEAEAGLITALDQLCSTGRLTADIQARFEADWSLDQQLEILALAGAYQTISFVANVAQLPPEPFAARFPA